MVFSIGLNSIHYSFYMVVERRTKSRPQEKSDDESKPIRGRDGISPVVAYRELVAHSSSHFRADVEFHEQPRQIMFGMTLLIIIAGLSSINLKNDSDTVGAIKNAIGGCIVAVMIYCALQTKDGLLVCWNMSILVFTF